LGVTKPDILSRITISAISSHRNIYTNKIIKWRKIITTSEDLERMNSGSFVWVTHCDSVFLHQNAENEEIIYNSLLSHIRRV
jgi:hypothetical protein